MSGHGNLSTMIGPWLAALGGLLLSGPVAAAPDAASGLAKDDPAFWRALVQDCAVPTGESAAGLVQEAIGYLGSPDPVWRDDIGYGVVAACVYRARKLGAGERLALVDSLSANLKRGIGQVGDDSVLLRSFSALDLSLLAALELQSPVLNEAGFRQLLNDAFTYLGEERDVRGFDSRVGWIHATAHTGDLLKFLARDPRFSRADQARLLDAVWMRMTAAQISVFTYAEDERLAAAVLSVIRRADFDTTLLEPWLEQFVKLEQSTWAVAPPPASALVVSQNARNLLKSLYVLLSLPTPAPAGGQMIAREAVLATLQQIRR